LKPKQREENTTICHAFEERHRRYSPLRSFFGFYG
jgi:hypothetical protein